MYAAGIDWRLARRAPTRPRGRAPARLCSQRCEVVFDVFDDGDEAECHGAEAAALHAARDRPECPVLAPLLGRLREEGRLVQLDAASEAAYDRAACQLLEGILRDTASLLRDGIGRGEVRSVDPALASN